MTTRRGRGRHYRLFGAGALALCLSAPVVAAAVTNPAVTNPAVTNPADRSSTPAATPMSIYFGTTHVHTGRHNDHGQDDSSARQVFQAAKESKYDFLVLTEHSGPTGPDNAEHYYAKAEERAESFTEPGSFVGLAGYEFSENGGDDDSDRGHMTVFGTSEFRSAMAPGVTFSALEDYLVDQARTRDVFAGFNHPPAEGHEAGTAAGLTPQRREVVALSETSNGGSYQASAEAAFYDGFVHELDAGWRVAPTCGLDSHGLYVVRQDETDDKKPCRTGILAPSLTRADVIAAIQDRRVYSTRDVNLRTKYSANGSWMGSSIGEPGRVDFDISAQDPDTDQRSDEVRKIQVIGEGGAVLASQTFASHDVTWRPTVDAGANRYMFVRVFNGEREAHTAVLAPVWLE